MKITYDDSIKKALSKLESSSVTKVMRTIDLLERFGKDLRMPHSKKISESLFELRVKGKQEIRVFYTFRKNYGVLLHLFIKKSQKTPLKELAVAKSRLYLLDYI